MANHPLNKRNRLAALGRFARWQIESRLKSEIEFEWIDGTKLLVRKGMTGATGNIYCGLHEYADMAFFLHALREDDLFVDVGANIGSYTILASAVCGAHTIAIEPDPTTLHFLIRNVEANSLTERVDTIETAVGRLNGHASFTTGLDTVNKIVDGNEITTRTVRVRRLDDILRKHTPTFIKLDVEGYETEVLAGATATLQRPELLAVETESRNKAASAALSAAGFRECAYHPEKRQVSFGQSFGSNALWIRKIDEIRDRINNAPYRSIYGVDV